MAASIERTFLLIDRASGPIRGIRREVRGLERDARAAGREMDRLAGADQARELEERAGATRQMASAMGEVRQQARTLNPSLQVTERRVVALRRELDRGSASAHRMAGALRSLGAVDARPRVRVEGIAQARSEVAALRRELRELSARSVQVNTGMAGGGAGSVAGGAARRAGGGGATAAFVGTSGFGVATTRTKTLAIAAAGALPIVDALAGSAAALMGSLAGAGLGAGAVGVAGGGVLAAGIGGVVAVAKPAQKALEDVTKAQTAYTDAVAEHGKWSKEAAHAQRDLARAYDGNPGIRRTTAELRALKREWASLTTEGRRDWIGMRGDVAAVTRRAAPRMARNANRSTAAVRRAAVSQARFLAGDTAQDTLENMSRAFARNLPSAERSLQNVEVTFMRIADAALPFFEEAVDWVEDTTMGWRRWSTDTARVERSVESLVDDTKRWAGLLGEAGELLQAIGQAGRPAGGSMVEDLTAQLDRWERWIERNPVKVDRFFRNAADDTKSIAGGVADIVGGLHDLAQDLRPLVPMLERLASAFGIVASAGPGAFAMLAGGVAGARGRGGQGGGLLGMLPFMGGGAAAAGGAGSMAGIGSAAVLGAGALGARGATGSAAAAARFQRMVAQQGAMVGASRSAALAAGAGGARFAGPVSQLGATRVTAGSRLSGFARGAAGKALPIAALFGLLDAYGFEGGAAQKAQAGIAGAASTLTFGASDRLLSRPKTRGELDDQAGRVVSDLTSTLSRGQTLRDLERDKTRLRQSRDMIGGRDLDLGSGDERRRRLREIRAALNEEIAVRKDMVTDIKASRNASSRTKAERLTQSFGEAYDIRAAKDGPDAAMDATVRGVYEKMRQMAPAGARILGENTLAWAREQAKANPALLDEVEWLTKQIEQKFSRTGRHVRIVNGRILTGSQEQWRNIKRAITEPAELARQEASASFTALQQEAVGALQAMGYSKSDASKLVAQIERGNQRDASASDKLTASRAAGAATRGGAAAPSYKVGPGDRTGDGVGEDRPTLANPSGATPQTRAAAAAPSAGNLKGAKPALGGYAADAARFGLRVSSGARPGAITNAGNRSYHSSGDALDLAGSPADMMRFAQHAASTYGSGLEELIYSPLGFSIKNGQRVAPYAVADHYDHVHLADTAPSGAAGGAMGGMPFSPDTMGPGMISLTPPGSNIGGVAGALSAAASGAYAMGLQDKLNAAMGAGGFGGDMPGMGPMSGTLSKQQIAALAAQVGFPDPNLVAAIALAESGGRVGVINSIGATGLMQILQSAHPSYDPAKLASDPLYNLRAAFAISSGGTNWQPWEAYTRGMHTRFLGDGIGHERRGVSSSLAMPSMRAGGGSGGGGGGAGRPILMQPQISLQRGMGQSELRSEFARFADMVWQEIAEGAEEDETELMA